VAKHDETLPDDDAASPIVPPTSSQLERGASLGRYIVTGRLGSGGMGVVYAAYDPELDRKLAIKLLREDHGSGGATDRRARLVREAQALARLDHPNVVAVFDVGTFDDLVFVAMELIAGVTVRDWLAETPRDWRAIVEVYRQAGRGLAAAHALGIVHRDFKPDNVLIDASGRVRVVDFGLARTAEDQPDGPSKATSAPDGETDHEVLGSPLTRTGALIGTPGYIAPEQQGGQTRATVDQFSLCVSLWHALYGELPFGGDTAAELAAAAAKGSVKAPPAKTRVPAWLHRVLLRGIASDPAARFPSMDALVDALGADPARRRRRALVIAGTVAFPVVAIAIVIATRHGDDSMLCRGADGELADAWSAPRRQTIEQVFAASDAPYAVTAAAGVVAALDRYAASWTAMRTDACEATRVRGEQSEDLLDLRMGCLDARKREMRALVDVFARADGKVVEKSVQAAQSLTPITGCADTQALRAARMRLPDPALQPKIDAIRGKIAEARALEAGGRYAAALELATPTVADARATHYRPLEAEALVVLGTLQKDTSDLPAAQATLEAGVIAATAGRDDLAAAEAATLLVRVVGYDRAKHDDGDRWVDRANAFLEAHADDRIRSLLANNIGVLRFAEDRQDDALASYRESLALRERLFGADSPFVAASYDNIGLVEDAKGDTDQGTIDHKRALAIDEAALGSMHPLVGTTLGNLATSLTNAGRYDEAMPIAKRALAIKQAAYGPETTLVAMAWTLIGNLEYFAGHYPQAADIFRKVIAIKVKTMNGKHPSIAASMTNLANVLERMGKYDEARHMQRDALEMKFQLLPRDHSDVAHSYASIAQLDLDVHDYARARDGFDKARTIFTKALGADSLHVATTWNGSADAEIGLHHIDAAIADYEQALAIRDRNKLDAVDRGETRVGLATAIWDKGDHARARTLATEAQQLFAEAGARASRQRVEVEAWLEAHR
jgi:tetratricopeptide (TPR) repeat protein